MPVQGLQMLQRHTTTSPLTTSLHDRKGMTLPRIAIKGSQTSFNVSFWLLVKKYQRSKEGKKETTERCSSAALLWHQEVWIWLRKKVHKQADQLFLSGITKCHALAISTIYTDDSLHIAKRRNTHFNSHCSYFLILSHDSTELLHLKARYRAVFLGIMVHTGKCNASICCCLPNHLQTYGFPWQRTFLVHSNYNTHTNCHATGAHTVFSYQPLFSGLRKVPCSQCSPLFPFCSTHFWHQMDLSSHQLSIPGRQEGNCYWSLQSGVQSRRQ